MSDEVQPPAAPAATPPPNPQKREEAVRVVSEIVRLMELPGRLESKDAADGGIAVALYLEGDYPGIQAGKRSHVVDSLQFIANKIVNRPGTDRRWISIGVGGFPEPRPPAEKPQRKAPAPPPAQAGAAPPAKPAGPRPPRPAPAAPATAPAKGGADELSLEVEQDPALAKAVAELAEKSARLGRFYAIAPMSLEDRARVLKAAAGTPGMKVHAEGEGRNRRVVFTPDKPAPMPKRSALPRDDEDELEG